MATTQNNFKPRLPTRDESKAIVFVQELSTFIRKCKEEWQLHKIDKEIQNIELEVMDQGSVESLASTASCDLVYSDGAADGEGWHLRGAVDNSQKRTADLVEEPG